MGREIDYSAVNDVPRARRRVLLVSLAENATRTLKKGMRVFAAGKLAQHTWQDDDGNKRQTVKIQVTHVGPDLQFQSAEVNRTPAQEKLSA
jgi:single-stranded DNA-binding protein